REALGEGLAGPALADGVDPHLRGHEDLAARDARVRDGRADAGLVAVDRRGVDVAVAELERRAHGRELVPVAALEDAEAEPGHRVAVVEREGGGDGVGHRGSIARPPATRPGADRVLASAS